MRTLEFIAAGKTWHLCLNGAALFNAYDKFGQEKSLVEHVTGSDKASFLATCWFLAELATQGELVRRYQGHDHGPIPTEQTFRVGLSPLEIPAAKQAVQRAMLMGFMRDELEDGPVDLGLAELQKKTAPG